MSFSRYIRRSLVESPYISVTIGLSVVGVVVPTIAYFGGGKQAEAANRYDFYRELRTDPTLVQPLTPHSSQSDVERQRKLAYKKYLAERKAAKGDEDEH